MVRQTSTGSAVCFSRVLAPRGPKLRLRSAMPSKWQRSKKSVSSDQRNAPKKPAQNIHLKKRTHQKDLHSVYLFADCSQRAVSRFGCRKSGVIKQMLGTRSEDTSGYKISAKIGVLRLARDRGAHQSQVSEFSKVFVKDA